MPLSRFIGREREISAVMQRLAESRLVVLTGPGGCGKTRLALEVAARSRRRFSEVWWVELVGATTPASVARVVASSLNAQGRRGIPLLQMLVEALGDRPTLLVLDNCEHLATACADLAASLLQACSRLRILATSRNVLGVPGETLYQVPPLSVPKGASPRDVAESEAVRLFVDRAQSLVPEFTIDPAKAAAVARICRRLDGLPLAVELAAARVPTLSLERIETLLDDQFRHLASGHRVVHPRHRTLRAAMDWSYELLRPEERRLFERLSVFVGGWTLEAAQTVCAGSDLPENSLLDLTARLVEQSLVVADPGADRYRLLEPVRQYAHGRLEASGSIREIQQRFMRWCVGFVEEAAARLHGADALAWLGRIEAEHHNIRAALETMLVHGERDAALRTAAALRWFWFKRGHFSEGREWFHRVLGEARPATPAGVRALNGAGVLAWAQGDLVEARRLQTMAIQLAEQIGDVEGLAWACYGAGDVAEEGYVRREAHYKRAWALFRRTGDLLGVAYVLVELGNLARYRGDFARAAGFYEESLTAFRRLGDPNGTALLLAHLGIIARYSGDDARSLALNEQSLDLFRTMSDRIGITMALHGIGAARRRLGDAEGAAASLQEGLALAREISDPSQAGAILVELGRLARSQGNLRGAWAHLTEATALLWSLRSLRGTGLALSALAEVLALLGETERAAILVGAAEAFVQRAGSVMPPPDRSAHGDTIARLGRALGNDRLAALRNRGRAMVPEGGIALALSPVEPPRTAPLPAGLTRREVEVLRLIAAGASNRDIAARLFISLQTTKTHVAHILRKLEARSRSHAAARARDLGLT